MQRSFSHDGRYSIQEMYEIANRNNQVFGIEGYNVVKKYEDPDENIRQRAYVTQKKGLKDKRYLTRRGSFMDPIDRIDRKKYPKPTHYDMIVKWPDAKPKNPKKVHETKRNTFIDDINNPKNVKAVPGVGQYNLELTKQQLQEYKDKLKSKKVKYGERDAVFSETEHLSNVRPGPGRYHPHDVIQRWKAAPQWDNPKEMKTKHANLDKKKQKSTLPDIGTYTPIPNTYETFASNFKIYGSVKITGKEPKSKKLGVEERFKDPKNSKVKRLIVPGPGNYDMIAQWAGKTDNKEPQKKDVQKLITKGFSKSIYY